MDNGRNQQNYGNLRSGTYGLANGTIFNTNVQANMESPDGLGTGQRDNLTDLRTGRYELMGQINRTKDGTALDTTTRHCLLYQDRYVRDYTIFVLAPVQLRNGQTWPIAISDRQIQVT